MDRSIENNKPQEKLFRLVKEASFLPVSATYEIELYPELAPHFLKISGFTKYEVSMILPMDCMYSSQVYELAKSLVGMKRLIKLCVDDLRKKWRADNYTTWSGFRQRVLDPAVKEINKYTDIELNYTTKKTGRSITYVVFHIKEKP